MKIKDLIKKKIAILGYGVNNQALFKWFIQHGARNITICDKNKNVKLKALSEKQPIRQAQGRQLKAKNIKYQLGEKYLDNLGKFNIVFRTPGIPYLHPKIQEAKKKGVEISSQTKLFFDLCPAKIIGITGTKGKGTTATLISEMLKLSSKRKTQSAKQQCKTQNYNSKTNNYRLTSNVYLAGNIGADPFNFLNRVKRDDIVILELSSFQLQDLHKSPYIAVVLNITSDHLDYHKDNKEYIDAKLNIVRHQTKDDFAVINLDYLTSFKFASASPTAKDYYFSIRKSVDLGAFIKNDEIVLRTENKEYKICKISQIKLLGSHNLENICAAVAAAYLAGADIQSIKKVTTTFTGREHRLEFVGEYRGVKYYNDSCSTNPDTAIAAIKSFHPPIILIAGGSDKGADYSKLGKEISQAKNIKKIILIGKTASKIKLAIKQFSNETVKKILEINNFQEAVRRAIEISKSGDTVLLSPASASFDMFKNYEERGDVFKRIVENIR